VAGEVIEHLPNPSSLFAAAASLLAPGGILVVTTPNPYAPWRARAGQLGIAWENADHLYYIFPAGLAELGERFEFELVWLSTWGIHKAAASLGASVRLLLKAIVRKVLHRAADLREYPPTGSLLLQLPPAYVSPLEYFVYRRRSRYGLSGEHSLYGFRFTPSDQDRCI
jgi:SAM-dependent methyltransferase